MIKPDPHYKKVKFGRIEQTIWACDNEEFEWRVENIGRKWLHYMRHPGELESEEGKVQAGWRVLFEEYWRNQQISPIAYIKPNIAQMRLFYSENDRGEMPRTLMLEGSNKVGKCMTYQTLIDTPHGKVSVGELYDRGEPFDVYAFDGQKKVISKASAPFKKPGLHECHRIGMLDGSIIEAADHHKILTSCGWRSVQSLYESFSSHRGSNSERNPSVLPSGVLHLSERASSSRFGYRGAPRLYGGQPLSGVDSDKVFLLLKGDVPEHIFPLLQKDGRVNRCKDIHQQFYDHLSSLYDRYRHGGRHAEFSGQSVYTILQSFSLVYQEFQPPSIAEVSEPRSIPLALPHTCDIPSFHLASNISPLCEGNNRIVSHNLIGRQEVFDFEVEKFHNYFAGGLIHHNTFWLTVWNIAMACGYYPWLIDIRHYCDSPLARLWQNAAYDLGFEGGIPEIQERFFFIRIKDYRVPNVGLILGETYTESVDKKLVPEHIRWIPKDWEYDSKKNQQGVINKLTFTGGPAKGGIIHFRSYNSIAAEFEGIDQHRVGYDEPPPEDIYTAVERGNIVADARSAFSFTALKEPWIYMSLVNKAKYHWI